MKLLWLLLVAFITVNVSNAKSIIENVTEKAVNKTTIIKMLNSSSPVTTTRRSIIPNIPDRSNKFVINPKPTIKTESQTTKPDNYRRLMKKLTIKYVNNNGKAKQPVEITTRRALMKIRKFTVKPHDIYAESVREKHNFNSNRKINTNNFRKPKSERFVTEKNTTPTALSNEDESSEQKLSNFKNVDSSIIDNDSDEIGNEDNKNSYVAAGSQKSQTIILFPKTNYIKDIKVDPEPKTSERTLENNAVSENKIPSDVINNGDKEKSIITNKLIQSEPKETISDQEKADLSEFNFINGFKKIDVSFVPDDVEISTGRDLDFFVI